MSGIIVATNGMLSSTEEMIALIQRMRSDVAVRSPPVALTAVSASWAMMPTSIRPPTAIKSPIKKKIVGHSTACIAFSTRCSLPPARRSSRKPPESAMSEDSICVKECVKNPRIVSPSTKSDRFSRA